jgi:hypothetical protein
MGTRNESKDSYPVLTALPTQTDKLIKSTQPGHCALHKKGLPVNLFLGKGCLLIYTPLLLGKKLQLLKSHNARDSVNTIPLKNMMVIRLHLKHSLISLTG